MANDFSLTATARTDLGKGASRRLRHAELIPAIVYGGDSEPATITLKANEMTRNLMEEAFYASLIKLDIEGTEETVILRDLHRHPYKMIIMHADFQRVDENKDITVTVPLHFVNEEASKGVKAGGMVSHIMTEVEIFCLPKNIPEFVEVDVADIDLHSSIHLSDLVFPEGVQSTMLYVAEGAEESEYASLPVVSIIETRGGPSADEDETPAESADSESKD
ncbi:MAG: 50S ribosomal protein L25/general stress protein Ctc [Cocleimonas sp.]|nr:50S ribosomal protein L25/general stress protein Ctc [Cocleimonas sp.]